jgi:hypothetical protein
MRGDGIAAANVAFARDGNRLFWGGDEDFQLVDLESGQASRVFHDAQAVRWISVTNDGRYVATSGEGIAVYDTTSGERCSLGEPSCGGRAIHTKTALMTWRMRTKTPST